MFPNSPNQQALSNSMLSDFQYVEMFPLTLSGLLSNLLTAIICGFIISMLYRLTHRGGGYSATFVNSLVILPIITSVVILLIGNNIARAFGLVGAMSVIRFRTALRDPQDIIFIFFTLAVGMAAGVGLGLTAVVTTIAISIVMFLVIEFNPTNEGLKYMLQMRYNAGPENDANFSTLLSTYCNNVELVSYKKVDEEANVVAEGVYRVQLKKGKSSSDLVHQLNQLLTNCYVVAKLLDVNGNAVRTTATKKSKLAKQTPTTEKGIL